MFIVCPLIKTPKESEMSLSTQVKESVNQAAANLREALAFAARAEHPVVINSLAELLGRLESLEQLEDFMNRFNTSTQIPNNFNK